MLFRSPVWAQRDEQPDIDHPTDRWVPGERVVSDFDLSLPADAPADTYSLVIGLYDVNTGQRFPVNRSGQPAGDAITLFEGVRK